MSIKMLHLADPCLPHLAAGLHVASQAGKGCRKTGKEFEYYLVLWHMHPSLWSEGHKLGRVRPSSVWESRVDRVMCSLTWDGGS